MSSSFTRRSLLHSGLQSGIYSGNTSKSPARDDEQSTYTPSPSYSSSSSSLLTSKTRLADQQNEKNYDQLLRRIRADQRQPPGRYDPNSDYPSSTDYLQVGQRSDRAHSLSPSRGVVSTLNNNNNNNNGSSNKSNYSWLEEGISDPNLSTQIHNIHSRHQEFLRRRHQQYGGGSGGGGAGADESNPNTPFSSLPASSPTALAAAIASRPTYSVNNVPLRNLEELRETIAIRRQYYRERLFGKPEGENDGVEENEGQMNPEIVGTTNPEENGENSQETIAASDVNGINNPNETEAATLEENGENCKESIAGEQNEIEIKCEENGGEFVADEQDANGVKNEEDFPQSVTDEQNGAGPSGENEKDSQESVAVEQNGVNSSEVEVQFDKNSENLQELMAVGVEQNETHPPNEVGKNYEKNDENPQESAADVNEIGFNLESSDQEIAPTSSVLVKEIIITATVVEQSDVRMSPPPPASDIVENQSSNEAVIPPETPDTSNNAAIINIM